jgi:hypothetical protein
MIRSVHNNHVRFKASFEVDLSTVKRLQQWYEESNFTPANTPKISDPSHPFQSIYVEGIKQAMLRFKPLLDAIPEDFKLVFNPYPPFITPGIKSTNSDGSDHFHWIYNQLHPNPSLSKLEPTKTETSATHRYWTPLGQSKRPESITPTVNITNAETWNEALNQFKQWLPVGILAIALKAQTLQQDRMNKLNEFQQQQQDKLALMIARFASESAVYYPAQNIPDITQGQGTEAPT